MAPGLCAQKRLKKCNKNQIKKRRRFGGKVTEMANQVSTGIPNFFLRGKKKSFFVFQKKMLGIPYFFI